jgi:hypothetical protein
MYLQLICSGSCGGSDEVVCERQIHTFSSTDQINHLFISSFIHTVDSVSPFMVNSHHRSGY